MLEIFQSAPCANSGPLPGVAPASADLTQTIEKTGLLETLGLQREPGFTSRDEACALPSIGDGTWTQKPTKAPANVRSCTPRVTVTATGGRSFSTSACCMRKRLPAIRWARRS